MMVHKSLLVLLAIGSLSAVESLVTSNFSSSELLFQQDDYSHLGLSLEQVKRIMLTEVNEEFGERRLTNADSEALWSNAVKYEWSLAEEREEKAQQEGRRTQEGTLQLGASPFVVCDMHFGKTGESCKATVESYLGSHLIPLYNKIDMTCFLVVALPSDIQRLPSGVAGVPLAAEMKMAAGLSEDMLTADPMLSRIGVFFCASEAESSFYATGFAAMILDDLVNGGLERRLGVQAFLESRATRDPYRRDYWRRHLQGSGNSEVCREMLPLLEVEVSPKGNTLMLTLPPDQRKEEYRECLRDVVLELIGQPEVCYVGAYQQLETLNVLASGIVQSGSSTSKPFYDVGLDGDGQVVALSDTGMDTDNCYFWDADSNVRKDESGRFDLDVRKVVQYFAYADDKETTKGHGTHVAGTIVGRRARDGVTESDGDGDGVARAAQLAFFDIGDTQGLRVPSAEKLFAPGYDAGARIHSASWGSPNANAYSAFDLQIDEYAFEHPDFLFVTAVGNGGRGNKANSVGSPATCKNAIAVGASQNTGSHIKDNQEGPDYLMDFSSRGPTRDGRLKPDVIAPGQFILSAKAVLDVVGECDDTDQDGLQFKKGTSMAAPVVAGTAALIRQYFQAGWHVAGKAEPSLGISPTASLIKAVLVNGGQELVGIEADDGEITNSQAYDRSQGFGRVNLLQSLPLAFKNKIDGFFVNSQSIGNGKVDKYEMLIDTRNGCSDPLSATLVWTDPPGSPSCNTGCVLNDLDLFVTLQGQSGRFFPNGLGSADTVNNVERVRINRPTDGAVYTVHVRGSELLQAQDYSLVVTGCLSRDNVGSPVSAAPTKAPTPHPTRAPTNQPTEDAMSNDSSASAVTVPPTPATACLDKAGDLVVSSSLTKDCDWLARNLNGSGGAPAATYEYLCKFLDVAVQCPVTCSACLLLQQQQADENTLRSSITPLAGTVRWFGTVFDVRAKRELTVRGFDIHIAETGQFAVQILTRSGPASKGDPAGENNNSWIEICQATVSSQGRRALTAVPASACRPVTMAANSFQTFYVSLSGGAPDLVLTDQGGDLTVKVADTSDLSIRSGYAVTFFDQDYFEGFSFNGGIRYTVVADDPSVEVATCSDLAGTVVMDDAIGARDCAWLAENWNRFAFVCDFAAAALHCPETCNVCSRI